jgi:hypothetical protein
MLDCWRYARGDMTKRSYLAVLYDTSAGQRSTRDENRWQQRLPASGEA